MMNTNHLQYDNISLKELAEKLHLNYYDIMAAMIGQANMLLEELKQADLHDATKTYTNMCAKVLACMTQCLYDRRERLVPYLKELHEKDASAHDCSNCKGGCDIHHYSYLMNLQESHAQLRKLFYDLHVGALPLFSPTPYPLVYRKLRDEMQLVDTIVSQLLHLEEAEMMPRIVQSQKKINVRTH